MIKKKYKKLCILSVWFLISGVLGNQVSGQKVTGTILESGTGDPVQGAVITVSATGYFTESNEEGVFSIDSIGANDKISVTLPGYDRRELFTYGRDHINISLVPAEYSSFDDKIITPSGVFNKKDVNATVKSITPNDFMYSPVTSLDQALQGKVPGTQVTYHGGMPGQKTWTTIRGISSLVASSEPLVIIDGMLHFTNYADRMLVSGYSHNPMDIIDIDDVVDISIASDGTAPLGATGANGVIYVNTEKETETSTSILVNAYTGITLSPASQSVMNVSQFRNYFSDLLTEQGYSNDDISSMYPWFTEGTDALLYYKYHNNTDWQKEIFKPALLQKYHIFLKGGDDIATYNISTGYLKHQGTFDGSKYSRYNLRINGRINITDKFSVTPNGKLSLADTYIPEQGPDYNTNPILAALRKPPIMAPYSRDEITGQELNKLDDVGAFNVSNPLAIIQNGTGQNRNYHFLTSAKLRYAFNENFSVENMTGLDFNNARENLFIPDVGLASTGGIRNSPRAMVNEYRSTQNNTVIDFKHTTRNSLVAKYKLGLRILSNKYKFDRGIDFNTPTDDFTSLGDGGAESNYLRVINGEFREMNWVSNYGVIDLNFKDKYYINASASYDGTSLTNEKNRYALFPSITAAWRLSSERIFLNAASLDELKLHAGWSNAGNLFSNVYDFSKLFYVNDRLGKYGVPVRESIPNEDLEMEKETTIHAGIDASLFGQGLDIHLTYYISQVNNLILPQSLPSFYGFTEFYDNGGRLQNSGIEFSANTRFTIGKLGVQLNGVFNSINQEVTQLDWLKDGQDNLIIQVGQVEYINEEGLALNSFYGYETNGIYQENTSVTGPNGITMQNGDIRFVDRDGNNIINDDDKTVIGNPNPDMFGSLRSSFEYERFQLSFNFIFSAGNEIYNYTRYVTQSMDSYANQSPDVINRWNYNGVNDIPKASVGDPRGNTVFSDRWIEDGSYLKLKELTLSYNVPVMSGLYKNLIVYVTASNLLTFTKYSGYDPEFFYMNSPYYLGIDYGKMPLSQSFILGVKLEL